MTTNELFVIIVVNQEAQSSYIERNKVMKKLFAIALVLTMMLSMLTVTANAAAWDGTTASASLKGEGTADSPYLIESAEDLKYIQVKVNEGETFAGKYFKQTADIDLNNKEWTPIGERTAKPFIGLYDGNGYKIVNFYQTFSYRFGGLFAYMTTTADFTPGLINITLEGKMDGGNRVGDIYSGALLGWCQQSNSDTNKIVLANCVVDVDMTLDVTGKGITGDIILANVLARSGYINVYNCVSYGDITIIGDGSKLTAGGVVAYAPDTDIINCVNYSTIIVKNTSAKDNYVGGVLGATASSKIANKIENCINYGTVISECGNANYTGGVVGCYAATNTTISNCANTADITSKSISATALPYAGGILGYSNREGVAVINGYNSGAIETHNDNKTGHAPGGIVGVLNNAKDTSYIKDCATITSTFKGWMAATNPATNCTVEADATVVAAAIKAIEDVISAADSATLNGVTFKFVYEAPETPPAPETTAPETTEPDAPAKTGDASMIFVVIAVMSLAGVAIVAKKREN